ncbi:MAG: cytochrome b/b6 domain-containing protein [Gammaproteobacteria bacterium]|nr:cytochrome b/b6 domain-containing protein [Gammaproteobacteria bacterium]
MTTQANVTTEENKEIRPVRVWDLPVRLFHWLLFLSLTGSWVTAEAGLLYMDWHMWLGYTALSLVLFRLLWGIWGSRPARFSSFLRGPKTILNYSRTLGQRSSPRHPGHNPLGGVMVVVLLLLVALQGGSGLFASDDIFTEGPLYHRVSGATSDLLTTVHHLNFNLLLAAVGLHVAAVLFYLLYKRQNLIKSMFTGNMPLTKQQEPATAPQAPLWRALLLLGLSAGAITWLVN